MIAMVYVRETTNKVSKDVRVNQDVRLGVRVTTFARIIQLHRQCNQLHQQRQQQSPRQWL